MLTALLVLAWSLVVALLLVAFVWWTEHAWAGLAAVVVSAGLGLAARCRAVARRLDLGWRHHA